MIARTHLRPEARSLLLVWLLACAFMIFVSSASIKSGGFPDPDDIMRLLEVRDWLGGQSWFDVSQYRLNGSAGVPMHWSRLVDVPIATVIVAARPFLGGQKAETLALVLVPLLTLGLAMLLVHRIALRLMSSGAALAAVAATPLSLGAMKQMRPMRIDHHGWQIVMALLGLFACFDERPRRSGVVAGAAMALWLNISVEGLPYAAAIGGLFAVLWVRDAGAGERLKSYLASLALSSIVIFGATHLPSTWLNQKPDVVTAADLAGFSVAALATFLIMTVRLSTWQARLGALTVVGVITLSAMIAVDPHFMRGPFSYLDPLVRRFWLEGVDEGMPMWKLNWTDDAVGLSQPLVGLAGAFLALRRTSGDQRNCWAIYAFLLLTTTFASTAVIRVATTASVIAMPGTAYLCSVAFRWARTQQLELTRAFSTTAAILIMAPAYAVPISVSSQNPRLSKALEADSDCTRTDQVRTLAALGRSEIVAPFDVTPAMLLHTDVRALATGHHRNVEGMRDTIRIFLEPASVGGPIIKSRAIDYVILCPGAPETIRYTKFGPHGLAADLVNSRVPRWLEPIQLPRLTTLKVWRVRKDAITG